MVRMFTEKLQKGMTYVGQGAVFSGFWLAKGRTLNTNEMDNNALS